MPEQPKQSTLSNVFGIYAPQHIFTKIAVELWRYQDASSIWTKNEPFPEPLFMAFNLAVTIWHMTDWLWMSGPTNRQLLARKFGFKYEELKKGGLDKGLKAFQDKVRADCPALNVCEEIANASKHMRRRTTNPNIKAAVEWHPAIEPLGDVKRGDLVMSLSIYDNGKKQDAARVFIEAMGYWEKFMMDNCLFSAEDILPRKIIPARP
ncbi:hypothetical protein KUL72_20100 [Bradyrhizobium arachidis]|uniref:hypothetical protein n=1 Tax=Bradyrhizobium arachidis TaxID=858423 RepID=UPI002161E328|nr:hypothetical protein [Bradyrhizobium arachidis]UVO33824.1 hypothetical protein KUL72_20100 [Bradyrhizobium arachidis]